MGTGKDREGPPLCRCGHDGMGCKRPIAKSLMEFCMKCARGECHKPKLEVTDAPTNS